MSRVASHACSNMSSLSMEPPTLLYTNRHSAIAHGSHVGGHVWSPLQSMCPRQPIPPCLGGIDGVSITCSTRKHAQTALQMQYDWSDGSTERIGYLLRQSEVMEMVAGYPSRSKTACFQGQRSAHAVQWCTDCCSRAVSGPALSPGSLGSAQAFQNPTGMPWCSAVTVSRKRETKHREVNLARGRKNALE